ncbi:MAG: biliverdin-producing heme oxygenase [Bacteroidales bacterium]
MNPKQQNTLHQLLKEHTIELHNKVHRIPYISNLKKNDIQIISYVGHLRALAIIYGTLENQFSMIENQEIKNFLENYSPRLPLILADLENLNANKTKDIIPAVNIALQLADNVLINSISNPYKLLGFIYTLEVSLIGGEMLNNHISETFNFQNDNAINYLSAINEDFTIFWDSFLSKINTNIIDNQQKDDVISASNEIFYDLIKIYESLYPIDEMKLGNHITSINPEAGNFPIPTNPLEIKAAITAANYCWNEFPYYKKRFGERGRRFAASDTVWLVSLCELTDEETINQVNWLANFLAMRGMPTYLMETQMQLLYHELSKLIPLNEPKYLKLFKTSEYITSVRL